MGFAVGTVGKNPGKTIAYGEIRRTAAPFRLASKKQRENVTESSASGLS
jgi:hypothetical protein